MAIIKLLTTSFPWEGIYVNDKLVFQDHNIPRDKVVDICLKHQSNFVEIEIDVDYHSKNDFFADNLGDIDELFFINKESIPKFDDFHLSPMDVQLLDSDDWVVDLSGDIQSATQRKTGCSVEGYWTIPFIKSKLVDLKDELDETSTDFEQLLSDNGLSVICESPFEIEDSNGHMITGECACYLRSILLNH